MLDAELRCFILRYDGVMQGFGYRWTPSILQGLFDIGVAAVVASLKFLRYGHSVSDQVMKRSYHN